SCTGPTRAPQPAARLGSPLRGTIRSSMPFASVNSWTGTCWAEAAAARRNTRRREVLVHMEETLEEMAADSRLYQNGGTEPRPLGPSAPPALPPVDAGARTSASLR